MEARPWRSEATSALCSLHPADSTGDFKPELSLMPLEASMGQQTKCTLARLDTCLGWIINNNIGSDSLSRAGKGHFSDSIT